MNSKLAADISDDRAWESSELAYLLLGRNGDLCRYQCTVVLLPES